VPSATPTDVPSATPTDVPSATPTDVPSATPTDVPSATPTDVPSVTPETTSTVTAEPSVTPETTSTVTAEPSGTPETTSTVTAEPSETPTIVPSETPEAYPPSDLVEIFRTDFVSGLPDEVTGSGWTAISYNRGNGLRYTDGAEPLTYDGVLFDNVSIQLLLRLKAGKINVMSHKSSSGVYRLEVSSNGNARLYRNAGLLDSTTVELKPNQWFDLRLDVTGNELAVVYNDVLILSTSISDPLPAGILEISGREGSNLIIDDMLIRGDVVEPVPTPMPSATPAIEVNFAAAMMNQTRIQTDVVQALQEQDRVRVIVNFVEPVGAQSADDAQHVQMISTQRSNMLGTMNLSEADMSVYRDYNHVPAVAAEVTRQGVLALLNNPFVESVQIDEINEISLYTARRQINVPNVEAWGYNGSGINVAVLDTGIQSSHTYLSDDVVAQKCFHSSGNCPGGGTESNNAADGHGHGTHVSGIITSSYTGYEGIANGSGIVAVKVLTDDGWGSVSDITAGLDWVYTNRKTYNIRVVNMSLGGSTQYNSPCDAYDSARARAVNRLNWGGVIVVAASGNSYSRSGISAPACIRNVISVGSVTSNDSLSSFSNVGRILDVFAPGDCIWSTIPTNSWDCWSGTSMASPVVAGVIALMLDAEPSLRLSTIRARLKNTGPIISGTGYRIRRIVANRVVRAVPGSVTMGNATWIGTRRPFANWTLSGDATRAQRFEIVFRDSVTRRVVSRQVLTRTRTCGSSNGTTCRARVNRNLISGRRYIVTVRGINTFGKSSWAYGSATPN
jgi:hypothetical protein